MSDTFTLRLVASDREFTVERGASILWTLLQAGIPAAYSCASGTCGACETTVVSGIPEHRDYVLSEDEKASNQTIMICCSTARSDVLELDL
ncbi:MAG: 2Fe-2S iron-sulfur cluster binding domain-containing protein [Pseudomonadota bacterium]